MVKAARNHRRPDYKLFPAWISGKLEQFQLIDHMIGNWEDMERREEEREEGGDTDCRRRRLGDPVRGCAL